MHFLSHVLDFVAKTQTSSLHSLLRGVHNSFLNPFASIGRSGTFKAKVEVRDICLNISFLTFHFPVFSFLYEKKVQSLL